MPLTLILMRHAKSGWDDPIATDHERRLTPRGINDARAMGAWLRTAGLSPDVVLCSDASRTRQTVAELMTNAETPMLPKVAGALYNASSDVLIQQIKRQTANILLVCAHNPGIGLAARQLALTPPHHPRFDDYPTAATTVMQFDNARWPDINRGTVTHFVIPADLNA
ncbi:SixA phosphatase family protein [Loktanella sp. R86503]|uniref:SixA phosphatase family protein n=1 Tax=Loktanella sp. R86503 TaxID=3093847 RepID=UPI0036DD9067